MESNGSHRSGLLTAGGILSIIAGACEIWSGGLMVASAHPGWSLSLWGLTFYAVHPGIRSAHIPFPFWQEGTILVEYTWLIVIGVPLLVLGMIAIAGGISAIRRKRFGLSLAGAICALPSAILGILAVIFVALGQREKKMAPSDNSRRGLLTAGGVLSIVAGVFEVIGGVSMAVLGGLGVWFVWWPLPSGLDVWGEHVGDLVPAPPPTPIWLLIMIGLVPVALGIFAIIGGVSAIRRKDFGVSLAGAICALPSVILGILAVIFVSLSKREFGAERKENGI